MKKEYIYTISEALDLEDFFTKIHDELSFDIRNKTKDNDEFTFSKLVIVDEQGADITNKIIDKTILEKASILGLLEDIFFNHNVIGLNIVEDEKTPFLFNIMLKYIERFDFIFDDFESLCNTFKGDKSYINTKIETLLRKIECAEYEDRKDIDDMTDEEIDDELDAIMSSIEGL